MRTQLISAGVLAACVCGCSSTRPANDAASPATAKASVAEGTAAGGMADGAACKLSPAELAARRQQLIPGLFERAERVSDIPDGLRFRFANEPGLLTDLSRVMEQGQDCCSFLRFSLQTEPNAGPVTFDVTGPAGTGEMLRKL